MISCSVHVSEYQLATWLRAVLSLLQRHEKESLDTVLERRNGSTCLASCYDWRELALVSCIIQLACCLVTNLLL